jgi:hypothetical protein
MLLGKVPGGGTRPLISSPKMPPKLNDPTNLDEVVVTAKKIAVPAPVNLPAEEDIPEIVVTGTRIPWYAWVVAGVAGFAVLDSLLGRRKA